MTDYSPAFEQLATFIKRDMRMSHIYQPVMLRELLRRKGKASIEQIARALLGEDRSQVEYYREITKNMVGRVLTSNRGVTERDGENYLLKGAAQISSDERSELVRLCDDKIEQYLRKRQDPWSHRRKSSGYVPGTLRYEILKRARYRCELCGTSAEHKALEVDHIVPRNHGGSDDVSNLQALCYSCNSTKRDRDDADFRGMAARYRDRQADCPFCHVEEKRIVAENELCLAIRDNYPVTALHTLIVPKRHVADFFELFQSEINGASTLLNETKRKISADDSLVSGFNVGINCGETAGQTIFHAHVHLIPRREGDVEEPRGGVRGVIPGKADYKLVM